MKTAGAGAEGMGPTPGERKVEDWRGSRRGLGQELRKNKGGPSASGERPRRRRGRWRGWGQWPGERKVEGIEAGAGGGEGEEWRRRNRGDYGGRRDQCSEGN